LSIAVVVGNPKPGSRTLAVARATADALSGLAGGDEDPLVVDLAEVATELFDPGSARVGELLAAVAGRDLVVVASPTYKATYTGLLKAFVDRYGNDGLAATVAVPVMTGAGAGHALAVEVHLRPLLVELGASVPTRGLYVTEGQLGELTAVVGTWAETARPLIGRALSDRRHHP
jgi:FMN reductase